MTRFQTTSVIAVSLMGIALAVPASAQQTEGQKRQAAFVACHKEADSAVPVLRTEQDDMNHYLVFSVCLEKRGYNVGANARGFNENR
jgi:invasion protein IalB